MREELYRVFDTMQEVPDQDLDPHERNALEARLRYVTESSDRPDLAQLADALLEVLRCEALQLVEHREGVVGKTVDTLKIVESHQLSHRRLKGVLMAGLTTVGLFTLAKTGLALALLAIPRPGAAPAGSTVATIIAVACALRIEVAPSCAGYTFHPAEFAA